MSAANEPVKVAWTHDPGSAEAMAKGCTCAVIDNGHGKGSGRIGKQGEPTFWVTHGCPVHSPVPLTD